MTLDPRSYRFQIRTHTRHDDGKNSYGKVLWRETDAHVEKCPLPFRVSTVTAKANEIAERGTDVAFGTVSSRRFWPGKFRAECWISAPITSRQVLSLIEGTRLGDSQHVYRGDGGAS